MSYTAPTFAEIVAAILADITAQFAGADVAAGSDWYMRANVLASLAEGEYSFVAWVSRQLTPYLAEDIYLDRWGTVFDVERLAGEDDEDYRARILLRTQNTPGGGNATDYEGWARQVAGVSGARVDENKNATGVATLGAVAVRPYGPAGGRVLSAAVLALVDAELQAERPLTAEVHTVAITPVTLNVQLQVLAESGYEFDWAGTKTTLAGSVGTTLKLDSTAGLSAGDRVYANISKVPPDADDLFYREQRVIASVDDATTVTLTQAFSQDPGAGLIVYPGGPLVESILAAVEAYFDGLSPGETCYHNRLEGAAALEGVLNQTLLAPAADFAAGWSQLICLGSVIITAP